MLHRFQSVLAQPRREPLAGIVEINETFIGGYEPRLAGGRGVFLGQVVVESAELSMLCGFDDDLAKQSTATSIRGLLTQIHPALEWVIGPHLDHVTMAEPLAKYPTPAALRRAGEARIGALLRKYAPQAWKH